MKSRKRRVLGEYIVADPEICHGQLTIRGTRILVRDLLSYVADGKDWDWICSAYDQKVSRNAIGEAVRLAGDALVGGSAGQKAAKRQPAA